MSKWNEDKDFKCKNCKDKIVEHSESHAFYCLYKLSKRDKK